MYQSTFTYGLVKPYPYKWFTWLVVVGGIAATALFSIVNIAANGYEASNRYVATPNDTEYLHNGQWLLKKPWSWPWSDRVLTTCQSQTLSIGTQFYSKNLALQYTVAGLYTGRDHYNSSATHITMDSSIAYHDDNLNDCVVSSMSLQNDESKVASHWAEAKFEARIQCLLYNDSSPTTVSLHVSSTVDKNSISSLGNTRFFKGSQYASRSTSLLFAADLTSLYYRSLLSQLESGMIYRARWDIVTNSSTEFSRDNIVVNGITYFDNPGVPYSLALANISSNVSAREWASTFAKETLAKNMLTSYEADSNIVNVEDDMMPRYTAISDSSNRIVKAAISLDGLAKSLYSLMLTDLGQNVADNIFACPNRTMSFVTKSHQLQPEEAGVTVDKRCNLSGNGSNSLQSKQLDTAEFYKQCNLTLPEVLPAQISLQYLCQVPKLKSPGSVITSVIIADLVCLQALWKIFNIAVFFFLQRQDPEAYHCAGCTTARSIPELDEIEIKLDTSRTKSCENYQRLSILDRNRPASAAVSSISELSVVSRKSIRWRNDQRNELLILSP